MSFRNFVCWKSEALPHVLNTEALQMDDHIFLATHHPVQMKRAEARTGRALSQTPMLQQQQLLDELLDPKRDYVLGAVLGDPGTGKSHLVRWLALHLPEAGRDKRHVILVRRGATLRVVIGLILEGMKGESFDALRERLARAADRTATIGAMREQFINDLSIAVGPHGPRSDEELADFDDQEDRDAIIQGLPLLLKSSQWENELTRDDGIVAELVEHTVGNQGMERLKDKRGFEEKHINWDIKGTDLDVKARQLCNLIRDDEEFRQKVIDWINLNLDWAMTRLLDLSGEDLISLMAEVRAALQEQGKELVLLIEDLSNLQGMDNALLEALLVRPKQEKTLCPLRALFAVTTGYYENIADNVRERVELPVTLDVRSDAGAVSPERLAQFAARYLNAVRMGSEELRHWHAQNAEAEPPNHCALCPHQAQCHEGFGDETEIGLYPFTSQSLSLMYERARAERQFFNPRVLINVVLRSTLERGVQEIPQSNFPPPDLATSLGQTAKPLGAELTAQIERAVAGGDKRRAVTLVELWGEPQTWPQPEIVLEAFDLRMKARPQTETPKPAPLPATAATPTALIAPVATDDAPIIEPEALPRGVESALSAIDAWVSGSVLPEKTTADLRGYLFGSLSSFIDWNIEMFVPSIYVGTGKAFQPPSLYFDGQQTKRTHVKGVSLTLPLEGQTRAQLALVVKGLVLHNNFKSWNFPDGAARLRMLGDLLEDCSAEVLRQLRMPEEEEKEGEPKSKNKEWSPAPLAAELLAVGAQVNGKPTPSQTSAEFEIEALFSEFRMAEHSDSSRSNEWKDLQNIFAQRSDKLKDYLNAQALCTKGVNKTGRVVDSSLFAPAVRRIRSGWAFKAPISISTRSDAEFLRETREKIEPLLEAAVEAEANACEVWLQSFQRLVAPNEDRKQIHAALQSALDAASDAGLNAPIVGLKAALEEFKSGNLENCVSVAERLKKEKGAARLPLVARPDLLSLRQKSARVLEQGERFLDAAEARIEIKRADFGGTEEIGAMQQQIGDSLDELCAIYTTLSDDGDNTTTL